MGGFYANGYIPESALVVFQRGWNSVDGAWYWGLTPATYARHVELLKRISKAKGRNLSISGGWGAYRPYDAQVTARRIYGNGAAWPGTSSHGGYWEGQQTMAMDYSNWGEVFDWNREEFYQLCRDVGLTPGLISPERGYPDEPWHVVDLDPWGAVPSFPEDKPKEEDEMSYSVVSIVDGGIWVQSLVSGKRAHIQTPYHVDLLVRVKQHGINNDTFYGAELDIVGGYILAINPPADLKVDTQALADALGKIDAAQDAAVVKQAVKDALKETTFKTTVQ